MNIPRIHPGLKKLLIVLAAFFLLVIVGWLGIAVYVNTHKKQLLKQLTDQINEHVNGSVQIGDIEPTLIRGLPGIGVALKNVVLRDSLWATHKHDLLNAKYIYVSVNAFSLLRGKPGIREVNITDGSIYLYTDGTGYTNTNVLHKKTESNRDKTKPRINDLRFEKINFVFEDKVKSKLFRFNIQKLGVFVAYNPGGWVAKTRLQTYVADLCFNTAKGSFLKNKQLTANLTANYYSLKEEIVVAEQKIRIGNDVINAGGTFFVKESPVMFLINITSDGITFRNATALVSPVIAAKVGIIDFSNPISLSVSIKGRMHYQDTPLVHMSFSTVNNTLHIPGADIEDCSFAGFFNNQVDTAVGHNNLNSLISVRHLRGKFYGVPFNADTILLTNLSRPVLSGRFVANCGVDRLNDIVGSDNFDFKKGAIAIDLVYKGGVYNNDTTKSYIIGDVSVRDAAITYLPRNLQVTNSSFTLHFAGNDLYVRNVRLQAGKNVLSMEGFLQNFNTLYYLSPEKILLDWKISSKFIDIENFIGFLPKRKATMQATAVRHVNKVNRISRQLDRMLEMGNVHMRVQVDKAVYHRFNADNIAADITLTDSGLILKNTSVNNAAGKLLINASVDQRGDLNKFALNAEINHVDIRNFFYQCNNFGQSAITDSNIKGSLDASTSLTGRVNDNGKAVPGSLNGMVNFKLKDAALINFSPLKKIGNYLFRNRDMRNVTINELSGGLQIAADKFTIVPMHVESSALTLNVGGIYSMGKGTDINIDIPLRNPKKDREIMNDSVRAVYSGKGIVVHLKATDGNDGSVKIKWLLRGAGVADSADNAGKRKRGKHLRKQI